jgi:Uma2 family endonuclease
MAEIDIAMALPAHLQVTWRELQKLPGDGKRHELIEEEHHIWTSPNLKHQTISMNIAVELGTFLREHRLGEVLFARLDVVLSPIDVVEPDLLYVSNERSNIFTEDNVQGMPTC